MIVPWSALEARIVISLGGSQNLEGLGDGDIFFFDHQLKIIYTSSD
jgi:hypothetical protein